METPKTDKSMVQTFGNMKKNHTLAGNSTCQASSQCSNWRVFVFYRLIYTLELINACSKEQLKEMGFPAYWQQEIFWQSKSGQSPDQIN